MKQEEDGTKTFFYDTYALFAISLGQESYRKYESEVKIITTITNLYELYYTLIQEDFYKEAEKFFDKFLPYCVEIEPETVKEAAVFRLRNKKLNLSYVDALGYIIAQKYNVLFLTGDDGFRKLSNVEFVK